MASNKKSYSVDILSLCRFQPRWTITRNLDQTLYPPVEGRERLLGPQQHCHQAQCPEAPNLRHYLCSGRNRPDRKVQEQCPLEVSILIFLRGGGRSWGISVTTPFILPKELAPHFLPRSRKDAWSDYRPRLWNDKDVECIHTYIMHVSPRNRRRIRGGKGRKRG